MIYLNTIKKGGGTEFPSQKGDKTNTRRLLYLAICMDTIPTEELLPEEVKNI